MMDNQYLIISDLHLSDIEENEDFWMGYKSKRFIFDAEFSELLSRFIDRQKETGILTLILNGDVIDFDLVTAIPEDPPWPVTRSERKRGLEPTEDKSVFKLERVLADHPKFIDCLAGYLGQGHRLVYVMGNHDRELHFAAVRQAFVKALQENAQARDLQFDEDQIVFEPWFYTVPGEIYVEHGQQYDHYTSFRHVLSPVVEYKSQEMIALPMGNLSNRYLLSRMGFFNPHAGDYILNVFSYVWHWLKYYAFSRHNILIPWFLGSLVVMGKLLKNRRHLRGKRPETSQQLEQVAKRYELSVETVQGLYHLHEPPITTRFFRIVREFWIDRFILAMIMLGGTISLALVPIPLWIKLMVPLSSFPALYFIYEWFARGETIFGIEKQLPKYARAISKLVPVKLVTFGHTHVPRLLPLYRDVSFVDTGTWAPVTSGELFTDLVPGLRNYLYLEFSSGKMVTIFDSFLDEQDPQHSEKSRAEESNL